MKIPWLNKKKQENKEFAPNLPQICPKFAPTKFHSTPVKQQVKDNLTGDNVEKTIDIQDFFIYINEKGNKSILKMSKELGITIKKCRLFRETCVRLSILEKVKGTHVFYLNKEELKKWIKK